MPRPQVHAERRADPPTWIVELHGEHDLATSRSVAEALERALGDETPVVVDLTGVSFAESAILGVLLEACESAGPDGRLAIVARPRSQPDRLFDLVDARSVLQIFPDLDGAIGWCQSGGAGLRLDEPA